MGVQGSTPRLGSLAVQRGPGTLRAGTGASIRLPGGVGSGAGPSSALMSIPAKQERGSSSSGDTPSARGGSARVVFVALGKY